MFRFQLPDIGEGVVEAEVVTWHVAEGDAVALDQVLVELMTDKANVEIPSPAAGTVAKLCYAEGDIVPVGEILIEIDDGAAQGRVSAPPKEVEAPRATADASKASSSASQTAPAQKASAAPPATPTRPGGGLRPGAGAGGSAVRAVPAVRALAERLGVELGAVVGTGPGGRIMRRDVEAAQRGTAEAPARPTPAASSAAAPSRSESTSEDPADWERRPLRGLRRAIARHMTEAVHRAAHFTYVEELDLTTLMERRKERAPDLSPLAFIASAVLRALPDYPRLNASIDDEREELILKGRVHLGIAVAAKDGLVVPVISNAQLIDTRGLAAQIEDLGARAREGKLVPAQLRGGTFTITSLGKLGGIVSTPIVNHPEVAILGVNAVRELPRYVGGELRPRQIMNLSISVDHRIADGQDAALFVRDVGALLGEAAFPDVFDDAPGGS